VRVALVGLGSAGRRHTELLAELGCQVVGFDPAGGGRADSAEEAMAAADAVVVASPSALHAEHVRAAVAARRPVLVEKPAAASASAAQALARAAEEAGVVAGVAMNWRFHPAITAIGEWLGQGRLGRVALARASFGFDLRQWRPGTDHRRSYSARAALGGGIVLDAIHELDYLLWLLGPAASVSAETGRVAELETDVEDIAVASIRFASGALAAVDLNFFEPAYRRGCVVAGTEGVARWEWGTGRVVLSRAGADDEVSEVAEDPRPTYRAELRDFLECVGTGRAPRASLADGAAAVALAESLKESARTGRRVTLD